MGIPEHSPIDWNAPISSADAARLIGVTPSRLRQLFASGHIERTGHGKTTAAAVARGFAKFWQDKAAEKMKGGAAALVAAARAAEIEMRIAEKRRELIPMEEAEQTNGFVVGVVNEELAGLAARLTRDVQLRRKYEAEINGSKARIAKALEVAAECLETGRELPYTDA